MIFGDEAALGLTILCDFCRFACGESILPSIFASLLCEMFPGPEFYGYFCAC